MEKLFHCPHTSRNPHSLTYLNSLILLNARHLRQRRRRFRRRIRSRQAVLNILGLPVGVCVAVAVSVFFPGEAPPAQADLREPHSFDSVAPIALLYAAPIRFGLIKRCTID